MLPPYSPRQGTAGTSQTLHPLSNSSSTGKGLCDLLCPLPCPCAQGDLLQEKEVYLLPFCFWPPCSIRGMSASAICHLHIITVHRL